MRPCCTRRGRTRSERSCSPASTLGGWSSRRRSSWQPLPGRRSSRSRRHRLGRLAPARQVRQQRPRIACSETGGARHDPGARSKGPDCRAFDSYELLVLRTTNNLAQLCVVRDHNSAALCFGARSGNRPCAENPARRAALDLNPVRTGDIVRVNKKGRIFLASVVSKIEVAGKNSRLEVEAIARGITYREALATEVVDHWKKMGRNRA